MVLRIVVYTLLSVSRAYSFSNYLYRLLYTHTPFLLFYYDSTVIYYFFISEVISVILF